MQSRQPGISVHLSKLGYYADFYVYPVLILALSVRSIWHGSQVDATHWIASVIVGISAWTALEYVLHRWVLHGMTAFASLHALHHERPIALIGTPTWLSATLFMVLVVVLAQFASAPIADGFVGGLMTGYLAYVLVHDAVHHRRAPPGTWLHRAKVRHSRHHRFASTSAFGVSTELWDWILGTRGNTQD